MGSAETGLNVVRAVLPSGVPIRVEIIKPSGDHMASVGLRDFDLDQALEAVGEIGSLVVEKLKSAKPTKATAELKLGFSVEAGKLTALWVGGKGEASLTVTMEWSEQPNAPAGAATAPVVPERHQ